MEGLGTNFIKIDTNDMVTKIARLSSDKGDVSVWNKGQDSVDYRANESKLIDDETGKYVLIKLFAEKEDANFIGKDILLSFTVMNVDYFGEGKFAVDENPEFITIKLASKIYRSEKRGSERLLTFPHHQVYSYFKITETGDELDNVISLADLKTKSKKEKKGFDKMSETGTIQAAELEAGENEEVVGFRVLDLANNGISFLANESQKKFFVSERIFDTLLLMFDGDSYTLKNGLLIYNVDYVGGKTGEAPIYKLGIKFDSHAELSDRLKAALDKTSVLQTIRHDFEEFVDE
ncbi:MAG: hypothetical protein CME70_08395 [Halobacteriovorax sp.]|nr:hypothetical protein [Halobacteriovorax sp.]|tara:strand:- start:169624 stop:170496 length:873 start_codon:yes stop_codon:yes gene_type:complete